MRRSAAAVAGSIALLMSAAVCGSAQAQTAPATPQLPKALVTALNRDLHLSPDQYLHRAALAQQLGDFADTARTRYPQAFAGSWLNEAGQAVVALADGPQRQQAAAAATAAGFTVQHAAKSESTLESQLNTFTTWLHGQPASVAQAVQGVGIDTVGNALTVRLASAAHSVDLKLPNFIEPSHVVSASPATTATPQQARHPAALVNGSEAGGDAFASMAGDISLRCSFGFNGTLGGQTVNITAGHCNPNQGASGTPNAAPVFELGPADVLGPQVGTFQKSRLDGHDYSIVAINGSFARQFQNNAVSVPAAPPVFITGVAQPVVGAPVCKSGARTGFSCGTIATINQTVDVGKRVLSNGFSANLCALPGDSGGTVITGTQALGVTSASTVTDYPICEIPNAIGAVTGDVPQLFATPVSAILAENPGLQVRTS
ncbi:S1 family peptidase [Skermania sp. ID1734]|uniref:S1 family peptidase n=1 Tax=Skermania sp. ID1734 TaxID=2597516 RepID=UPI00117D2803|nr:S1 family peptidase [Skermania sp. ID1734]TSE00458.1 S1 family peptidase [Skermania sp. ID1734]